jgi:hypothetical protein
MDEEELREWGAQLSKEIGAELASGRSKKWRCRADLRSRIVTYAQLCRDRGEPYGDIAARLGLVESTVARWLRREQAIAKAGFRSVAIVPCGEDDAGLDHSPGSIRVVTPHGYRIEGLDLQSAAYLLQVLR